jgi:phospholipid/cholesterol/gamma-HCH transport system substrate-binding protein
MVRTDRGLRVKRRLQGVAFLVVVAALLGLTVAIYNKSLPWQSSDHVTLEADRVGNQLVVPADVKLDGVLVGRVSGVSTSGSTAKLNLQIAKDRIDEIPADVVARILPKTLFGEKFVDLVIPPGTSADAPPLQAGDVIQQDRSSTAIELQTVFNDLIPVLRALNPAQLSITLSNLATALRDRGDALGRNLSLVNDYFTRFNKDLPNFNHDISALADLASNYADATPDLLAMLRNFSVNARTVTEKQDVYAQFLAGSSDFARTAADVFGRNANRLIQLADVSKPVLDLYAKYSVVLECLPNGLSIYDRTRLEQAFGQGPYLHITLTPVGNRGAYKQSDRPLKSDLTSLKLPPNCYGLPHGSHGLHPVYARYPADHPSDNYACAGYTAPPTCPTLAAPGAAASADSGSRRTKSRSLTSLLPQVDTSGTVGTPEEQDFVSSLLDPMFGSAGGAKPPAGLSDLLVGPMLRGMAVSIS